MVKRWIARLTLGRTPVGVARLPADRPDAAFEATWRSTMRTRLALSLAGLLVWAAAIEARLVYLQVVQHEELLARARLQQQGVIEPEAARGDLVDRHGEILAYSVEGYRVIADPTLSADPEADAAAICAALGDCTPHERALLQSRLETPGRYAPVRPARFVSPSAAARLREFIARRRAEGQPPVITLVAESRRYYPKRNLASHVVGYVDTEGRGAEGLERQYDSTIAGQKGRVVVHVDGRGRREIATVVERDATAGATLELTIDLRLQHLVEQYLKDTVQAVRADGGSVVVMAPATGEILALASEPDFNPNAYWEAPDAHRRNRAITDTYEPGSTFKIVTAAAALNERLFRTTDLIDTAPGTIRVPGRSSPIREDNGRNFGAITFEDVLRVSSNVGAVRIGQRVGPDRMLQYIRRFGFGDILAPDFAGQSRGRVHQPGQVGDSSLASLSMGYEIGVTPLQVATAFSAIANGGLLVEPRVLRAVIRDGRRTDIEPRVLRRVIEPEVAATITALLEAVVENGTARRAAIDRYRVAGKTGTAKKVVNRRYSDTDVNVSFAGFVPSRQAALTILVVIDTPRVGPRYGGTIAAPLFKRIAEAGLQQMGVPPSINPAPAVIRASQPPAAPAAPRLPVVTRVGGQTVMPDLRGLSLRDAYRAANALGLTMTFEGDGLVVQQSPAPGDPISSGDRGAVELRRRPAGGGDR